MAPVPIKIVEVGPRDGLQNESKILSVTVRAELIDRLAGCGFSTIESGSLVSPKAVPQLADSEAVFQKIVQKPGIEYPMLVGNRKGLDRAIHAGVRRIHVFCAATESFSIRNNRCSIAQNLEKIRVVCREALASSIAIRAYISCALGCPFQGRVDPKTVTEIASRLVDFGCCEIALSDTNGVGTAGSVTRLLKSLCGPVPVAKIAVHFHDTYGQALANVLTAIQFGVGVIDSSVAGLGGCPFADHASGNLASEDLIYMLDGLGIQSGIDLKRLVETAWYIADRLGRTPESRVVRALGREPAPEFSKAATV